MFKLRRMRRRFSGTVRASTLGDGRRGTQVATFAAGCFWAVEAGFRELEGVRATRVGYTGGTEEDPSYDQVCADATGHAEAVEVIFDPGRVSYRALLEAFWRIHDPTTRDRQGWDFGRQYRSTIFIHDADQMAAAIASRETEQASRTRPVVTLIEAAGPFYEAEEYHQQFYEKQGGGSCAVTIEVPRGAPGDAQST